MRERGSRLIPEQESILEDPSNQEEILGKTTAAKEPGIARIHKRFHKPLRIIAVIIAVVFAVLLFFNIMQKPFDRTNNEYTSVTIEEGDDLNAAAKRLEEAGIVESSSRFSLVSRMAFQTAIKPGTYYLSPSMDSVSIAKAICKGNVTLNGFIIPDGFTEDQTFTSLSRDGFGDKDAFMKAASDPFLQDIDFIGKDVDGAAQIEGFLLPGTYRLDTEADETMIIMTMLDSFSNFFNDDYRARADELGLSVREVVVIASMIEKETSVDNEKARISSVLHNQLNLEMIDLPEVPLCSPGEASITAALYPEDSEDIYYVLSSKLDGTHVFTSDEAEYNTLLEEYNQAAQARQEKLDSRNHEAAEDAAEQEEGAQTESSEEGQD
jgi:UPF0755 protein